MGAREDAAECALHALRGGAVRERLRLHVALRLSLKGVIANLRRGVQRFVDVANLEQVAALGAGVFASSLKLLISFTKFCRFGCSSMCRRAPINAYCPSSVSDVG